MFGKLIKYEFRSIVKKIGVVWIALLAVSFFVGLISPLPIAESITYFTVSPETFLFSSLTYLFVFIALVIVTIMIVVQRYYRGVLGDEGYMLNTLPVKARDIVLSKGIVGSLVFLISSLVGLISIFLFMGIVNIPTVLDAIGNMIKIANQNPWFCKISAELLILGFVSIIATVYEIYASISIGHLANKHRVILGIAAYIAIQVVFEWSKVYIFKLSLAGNMIENSYNAANYYMTQSEVSWILIKNIIFAVCQIGIFHVISEKILQKKLNLL